MRWSVSAPMPFGLILGGLLGLMMPAVLLFFACRKEPYPTRSILGFGVAVACWYIGFPMDSFCDWSASRNYGVYANFRILSFSPMIPILNVWNLARYYVLDALIGSRQLLSLCGLVLGLSLTLKSGRIQRSSRRVALTVVGSGIAFALGYWINGVGPCWDQASWMNAFPWPLGVWLPVYVSAGYTAWPIVGFFTVWYAGLFRHTGCNIPFADHSWNLQPHSVVGPSAARSTAN